MTSPASITTDLQWSRRLKEAGFPQDSVWHWRFWHNVPGDYILCDEEDIHELSKPEESDGLLEYFAAPTAEEILRRLPKTLDHWLLDCLPNPDEDLWAVSYFSAIDPEQPTHPAIQEVLPCEADTLANAAARMYCHLAENKLLPASSSPTP